ncbi:galactokinase [Parapedobacter lycopersici]|uniref:galactokinase n=1 Tax=Parapedobacter lycopersici TaxID=1864939 RepID=UPI00333E5D7D
MAAPLPDLVHQTYRSLFSEDPLLVRSPGRINLIGEHTDYNQGWVLPAAIDKQIVAAIGKRDDPIIQLHALDQGQTYSTTLHGIERSGLLWPDYVLGVVQQLIRSQYPVQGFNLVFAGDIPQGAGLSSSAALECATAFALNELFSLGISKLDMALAAQAAENDFVGVKCGLMDQFASLFGQERQLIKLDCADFSHEYIPFNHPDIQLILFDTRVKHSLASSAYNERREQCERGVALIRKHHPAVTSLRDATAEQLNRYVKPANETVYQRCRYVVSEIQRVQDGCDDLKKNDLTSFGKRMFETHEGLRHQYEVSCHELDLLVDLMQGREAVLGARMMGGGFGGCTINMVTAGEVPDVIYAITHTYRRKTGKELQVYLARPSEGTTVLS